LRFLHLKYETRLHREEIVKFNIFSFLPDMTQNSSSPRSQASLTLSWKSSNEVAGALRFAFRDKTSLRGLEVALNKISDASFHKYPSSQTY
jgi:hypothetical protein